MSNDYFNRQGAFASRTKAKGEDIRSALDAISSGFDLLPKPRNDGEGFAVPLIVEEATQDDHAATKGQVDALYGSNLQNKIDSEDARDAALASKNAAASSESASSDSASESASSAEQAAESVIVLDNKIIQTAADMDEQVNTAIDNMAAEISKAAVSAGQSEASADLAGAYAAGVNMPPILLADKDKVLTAKPDGSGYELKPASNMATLIKFGVM